MEGFTQRRKQLFVLVAIVLVVVLAVAGIASAETFKVKAKAGDKWGPVHTYIGKGDKVVWTNPTDKKHDVSAIGDWSFSKTLAPGDQASRKFPDTGTFRYRCARHSAMVDGKCEGMCGIVHVFTN